MSEDERIEAVVDYQMSQTLDARIEARVIAYQCRMLDEPGRSDREYHGDLYFDGA